MRFTLTFVSVAVALSTATASLIARQSLPSCAVTCLAKANFGGCSQDDNHCLCANEAFINSTTTCIEAECSGSDLTNAEAYSQAICKSVGEPIGNSTSAASSASGASATPTSPTSSSTAKAGSSTGAAIAANANVLTGAAAVGFGILALAL
jgi:hypothetical protein